MQCIDKYMSGYIFQSPITLKLYYKLFNIKLDVAFVFKKIHFNQIILLETFMLRITLRNSMANNIQIGFQLRKDNTHFLLYIILFCI